MDNALQYVYCMYVVRCQSSETGATLGMLFIEMSTSCNNTARIFLSSSSTLATVNEALAHGFQGTFARQRSA